VYEVDPTRFNNQRRRSERISQSLPIVIRGIDLLGQPFEERTSTFACNLHGCRYSSKHQLPQNAWVTIETQSGTQARNVRARVAWSQRPQSIREFFQIAVELEHPANIWGLDPAPADWGLEPSLASPGSSQQQFLEREPARDFPPINGNIEVNVTGDANGAAFDPLNQPATSDQGFQASSFTSEQPPQETPSNPSPFPGEFIAELQRQARESVEAAAARASADFQRNAEEIGQQRMATAEEFFQRWKQEFEQARTGAREELSEHLTAQRSDFLNSLQSKFEEGYSEARHLIEELDQKAQKVRDQAEAAHQAASRVEQIRAELEALPLASEPAAVVSDRPAPPAASWNERLDLELAIAQSQWNELLQSSLDAGVQRLAAQLSQHSSDVLCSAEQKLAERIAELRQPLAETAGEAREALRNLRAELEEEMTRARSSLADIEHVAGRVKEYSAQLESSSHDTLNELHRRLENILESQTDELNRRAEHVANGLSQRLNPTLESLGHQLVERTTAEVEAKLAPRLERVPDLIRELSAREMQAEEGLRLHRERLRQIAENNQRDVTAQVAATVSTLQGDLDLARGKALANWNDELNVTGSRAVQSASDQIGQASEWFEQEARARLQVAVEQALGTANTSFAEAASQSANRFGEELERQSSFRLGQIQQHMEGLGYDVAGRVRTQLDEAAQAAAASFGEVLRGISGQETEQFHQTTRSALQERVQDLERSAQQVLGNLTVSAEAALNELRAQMALQIESTVSEGRGVLASEFASLRDQFAAERESLRQEWLQSLGQLGSEAVAKHQERLEGASDSWVVSSVRRLNEHGQDTMNSLTRLTDQSLRESCSKLFENLAQMTRNREANASERGAFIPLATHDAAENSQAQ
jgi:hypothetical protein